MMTPIHHTRNDASLELTGQVDTQVTHVMTATKSSNGGNHCVGTFFDT